MKKLLCIIIAATTLLSCESEQHWHKYKSVRIDDVKAKGVVVNISNYPTYHIVVKTDSNIVREDVNQDIFNYLNNNDTVK
jgi:hypothetical protein